MAEFTYKSAKGDTLSLNHGENFVLVDFDAQTAATADLSSIVIGGIDGDSVNNAQAQPRTIILTLRITSAVEQTKRKILDVVKLKQKGTIIWSQDGRDVEIEGLVESIEMPRWTSAVAMQITLHCEQPFWENVDFVVSQISNAVDLHYFTDSPMDMLYFPTEGIEFGEYDVTRTKSFYNAGDVAVGVTIEIVAVATAINPILRSENGEFFGVGYGNGAHQVVMSAGDVIVIKTGKNEKSVTLNGTNILGKVKPLSKWLQLETGENIFAIDSDDESTANMFFSLVYKERYI